MGIETILAILAGLGAAVSAVLFANNRKAKAEHQADKARRQEAEAIAAIEAERTASKAAAEQESLTQEQLHENDQRPATERPGGHFPQ